MELYKKYFQRIKLNEEIVDLGDLQYLILHNYEEDVKALVSSAKLITLEEAKTLRNITSGVYLLPYKQENFRGLADYFKIWHQPRSHHKNTLITKYKGNTCINSCY